jgi:ABC-2 type transport system ATP-binding protein
MRAIVLARRAEMWSHRGVADDARIATNALGKTFGEVVALDDVTLSLGGHRLVAVLGPNGAGKTTLLDLLEGLTEPTSGTVSLFGERIAPDRYPRRRVGVVMQREFVLDGVRVADYAELFAAIYGVSGGEKKILERSRLGPRAGVSVDRLSGGEAQRLFIAAASVHDPDILLLDEPTGELDPASKEEIGVLLRALADKALVVMTTHDLDEAERIADEVLFLFEGRVRAHGTKEDLLAKVGPEATLRDAFFRYCGTTIARGGEAL